MGFSDPLDQAQYLADSHNEAAIEQHRRMSKPEQERVAVAKPDGGETLDWPIKDCVDCDEPIEPQRLELGRIRCMACQVAKEGDDARRARFGKRA